MNCRRQVPKTRRSERDAAIARTVSFLSAWHEWPGDGDGRRDRRGYAMMRGRLTQRTPFDLTHHFADRRARAQDRAF